jgi:aspartate kinase
MKRKKSTSELELPDVVEVPSLLLATLPAEAPGAQPVTPSPASLPDDEHVVGSSLLVMKFGGTSLAGVEHLHRVSDIVHGAADQRPIVVLSAMGKTTNDLLAAAEHALNGGTTDISKIRASHEELFNYLKLPVPAGITQLLDELHQIISGVALLREVSERTRDLVVSFGERLSVRVFESVYNNRYGSDGQIRARAFDSWELGMQTSSGAGSANSAYSQVQVLPSSYGHLSAQLSHLRSKYSYVPIVTGYIAKDPKGTITTLGRDGSDLTATVIGAAVHASEVQIWKDVTGILTIDPRMVPNAKRIDVLTFEEAAELSTFGAKVVHPAAVMPAWNANVPMSVRSSLQPEVPGTRIVTDISEVESNARRVAAMSTKHGITMIVIKSTRMLGQHGFLAQVFRVFDKYEASVDVIATSEVTVSLTLDRGFKSLDVPALCKELETIATVEEFDNMAMLTLIAHKKSSASVLRDSFETFASLGVTVEMISYGASKINITFVLRDTSLNQCAMKLHEKFFES